MEVLNPSPPPSPAIDRYGGGASPEAGLRWLVGRGTSGGSPAEGRIYVAVGRSAEKTLGLLRWAFRRFRCTEIGLIHVHQPSPLIPTLLGKIPANQANEELVSNHRRTEKETTKKILLSYLKYCCKAQVQANIIVTETDQIHNGIIDLVNQNGIRRLVMGSTPDNCFNLKGSFSKVSYMIRNAPPFCEIWFISKGRHIWTREASAGIDSVYSPDDTILRKRLRITSSSNHNAESMVNRECITDDTSSSTDPQGSRSTDHTESSNTEVIASATDTSYMYVTSLSNLEDPMSSASTTSWPMSPTDMRFSSEAISEEIVYEYLEGVALDAERSKTAAFTELVKRKEIESEVAEAFHKVEASQSAHASEAKIRKALEDLLATTKMQHEGLVKQRDEAMRELNNAKKTLAILDSRAQEVALDRDEAAAELEAVQTSIQILRLQRQNIQQQEDETSQFDQWKCRSHARRQNCNLLGLGSDSINFTEFTLSDLQTATCDFSESFKLGQGGYGCVYKGEMMNRSVAIKKLHPHNIRGLKEFQQEVYVLSKLRHPHLLTFIGACPEALSLVCEYLPNGTLQDRLFNRANTPLTWKVRTRIIAEISSALLFLHSSKPEKIIHGDLKPENVFLDSNFNCKIGDFGICRLVPDSTVDTVDYPLFRRNTEPKGSFSYADPEYQRTELRTTKSDVYSFGIIVLQLLTGKPPLGLVNEVRRSMVSGKLSLVLDPSAGEWPSDVAKRLAEFGLQCSELNCRDRPDLTPEIVRELEQLHLMKERPVPPFFLCPILQEIMHDPQVAADGFTYEGRALKGWFENGRETSPMTNLRLEHLNLTPNHALRFAIQDWLCQS
ncbi:U-box domain-containing protein 33-like isoform X1 [Typha angustifolia]|uniref:U-box domain-containing protein 33-like isoform X1 n=2 Tax=Typha angustifolia TaxID=59011 RepID=UPI003C2C87F0